MDIAVLHQEIKPVVPGLRFRHYAGEPDFPAMVNLLNVCAKADNKDGAVTLEDVDRNYRYLTNCDPDKDLLMAEVNGELVGYSRLWWQDVIEGQRLYCHFAFVIPAYRDTAVWLALLAYNEYRSQQMSIENPHEDTALSVWADDSEEAWITLLTDNGYKPIRFGFEMVRKDSDLVSDIPMPDELEVCPVKEEHIQQIINAAREAFRDHWAFSEDEWNENATNEWREDPTFNTDLWQVAWDGDEVAGMILNFVNEKENEHHNRQRGYTETICVRRPWRRRGIARALLSRSIRMFANMGMTETALGVDAENPSGALRLYKSMGYEVTKRSANYRKPLDGLIQRKKEHTG